MSDVKSKLVDALVDSLRNHPERWQWAGKLMWKDIIHSNGTKLDFYYNTKVTRPETVTFSWWQRRRLRAAFRSWRRVHGSGIASWIEYDNARQVLELMRAQP